MTHYYLNQAQVAKRIGVAPRRVRGWQARGLLPRPSVIIGLGRSGVPGWSKTVIDRWNNDRLEGGRWFSTDPHQVAGAEPCVYGCPQSPVKGMPHHASSSIVAGGSGLGLSCNHCSHSSCVASSFTALALISQALFSRSSQNG